MFLSLKAGLSLGALALTFGVGYRLGGIAPRDDLDRYKAETAAANAAQLSRVVTAMEAQKVDLSNQLTRQQGVIDEYDKERAAAPTTGMGDRVLHYAARAAPGCAPVPGAAGNAHGPLDPAASAASVERFNELFDAVGRAIQADSARQRALSVLAPR